jgi:hypothetical protein
MLGWEVRFLDATYRPLKEYVARRGGTRLALHGDLRDRLVEWAVEEFPTDCPPDKAEEVLRARLKIRIRKQYGSVMAMILIGVLVNVITRLILEWWFEKKSHRVLMEGWHINAVASAHIPPRPPAA